MLGFSTYAALLPELRDEWRLSNAQAGVVSGMFFAGYVGTVSLWTALTDRVDGRRIYLAGGLVAGLASVGFGLFTRGFASALAFQALLGVGIAATYMPGLRLLSDRVSGPSQSRYVAFYTSFFGIGTALSLAMAGAIAASFGWQGAFIASGVGPLAAGALVLTCVRALPPHGGRSDVSIEALFPLSAWRRVLANRPAAGYTLGYAVHCLELFGSRAWMVAFIAFSRHCMTGQASRGLPRPSRQSSIFSRFRPPSSATRPRCASAAGAGSSSSWPPQGQAACCSAPRPRGIGRSCLSCSSSIRCW